MEFAGTTDTNGGIACTYIPHASLKSFNLIDFVNYVDDESKEMYVLQCSQSFEESFVDNTDPFTQEISDWTETFTCGGSDAASSLQVQTIEKKTDEQDGALLGFQYTRKMSGCLDTWEHTVEKDVYSAVLESRGFSQEYVTKIQPIAFVRSAVGTATGNQETCASSKSRPDLT